VDGNRTRTTYLKKLHVSPPDYATASINYKIDELIRFAQIVYQE